MRKYRSLQGAIPYLAQEERNGLAKDRHQKERKGAKGKGKSALFACPGEEETDPRNTETPENEVNFARRHVNLANVMGAMIGKERTGRKNATSLSIQASMEVGCVAFHG